MYVKGEGVFLSICACLHAEGLVHVCGFIPHKLLTDGDVQEVAKFNVNPDMHKSILHVNLISL